MNILITFDYELFFGAVTGTQHRCLIKPTDGLIKIAEKHNVCFSFFIDCGYLVKLEQYKESDSNLKDDYQVLTAQLKYLSAKAHDVQLHIHPHWEDTIYKNNKWNMDTTRYRLNQFEPNDIKQIFEKYSAALYKITGQTLHTYRAGGWCLQPFDKIINCFIDAGIKADSSVFKSGYEASEPYDYDFRNCPDKDWWRFDTDPVKEADQGPFVEIPISSMLVSPLFYWRLYLLGRLFPGFHKPIGDGKPILSKGYKKRILSRYTRQVISTDGYNARLLQKQTDKLSKLNASTLVILGHPKALSPYSLKTLDEYIDRNKDTHQFMTYTDFLKQNSAII